MKKTVLEVLEKGYSVIVVDDCSKDGSKKQLDGLPIAYLRHRVNLGQGAALQTGFDYAKKKGAKSLVKSSASSILLLRTSSVNFCSTLRSLE